MNDPDYRYNKITLSDDQIRDRSGNFLYADVILKYRATIREARGLYKGNGNARVHVDSLQSQMEYWCDTLMQHAEDKKAEKIKDIAKEISEATDQFPDWEQLNAAFPYRFGAGGPENIEGLSSVSANQSQINAINNIRTLQRNYDEAKDTPAKDFLENTDQEIRYSWCQKARAQYESCVQDYKNAHDVISPYSARAGHIFLSSTKAENQENAKKCAQEAINNYGNYNKDTPVEFYNRWYHKGETALDIASVVPFVGIPASIALAGLQAANGELTAAAISAAGIIPGEKLVTKGGKLLGEGASAIEKALPSLNRAATEGFERLVKMDAKAAEGAIDEAVKAGTMDAKAARALKDKVAAERQARADVEATVRSEKGKVKEAEVCAC
ncbi:hypothetical protein AB4037_03385 [Labrys sp. KB_33_2]|uniref:hypothetical protein n=1 Tax=unclassified Labrys (in: a-proteobacteria) TaxID=2688601 RepID=UPI003EB70472